MLHLEEIIPASIVKIEQYGIYLKHDSYQIIVLIPEISWKPIKNIFDIYQVGETIPVKLIEFIKENGVYKGSIRRLTPEENPYIFLQNHHDNTYEGYIKGKYSNEATIVLQNHIWGTMSLEGVNVKINIGDKLKVKVDYINSEHCKLRLKFVGII